MHTTSWIYGALVLGMSFQGVALRLPSNEYPSGEPNSHLPENRCPQTTQTSEKASRVALMFLLGNQWPHEELWQQYVQSVSDKVTVHIHTDKAITFKTEWAKERADPNPVSSTWGHVASATAKLMKFAQERDPQADVFVLLSGAHIPLKHPREWLQSIPLESHVCLFQPNHQQKPPAPLKASEFITLTREHIKMYKPKGDNCGKVCRGALDECCTLELIPSTQVVDRCDTFLWWRQNDGQPVNANENQRMLWRESGDWTCPMPMYTNLTYYANAAGKLLNFISEGHSGNHPATFQVQDAQVLRQLIDSPFLYARKFDQPVPGLREALQF